MEFKALDFAKECELAAKWLAVALVFFVLTSII